MKKRKRKAVIDRRRREFLQEVRELLSKLRRLEKIMGPKEGHVTQRLILRHLRDQIRFLKDAIEKS